MTEITRKPVVITVGGISYEAFDEDHTHSDIARWILARSRTDEFHRILGELLDSTPLETQQ